MKFLNNKIMPQENVSIRTRNRIKEKEPEKYAVIFHNDDFTPMDFVVMVLEKIFYKSYTEADKLMLDVHVKGKAIIGYYSYDIAITKTERAIALAREQNYPLRITVDKES